MEAEDLVVDEGCEGKVVKEIGEVFPHVCITIFAQTFVIETVDLRDLAGFVVSTEDRDALWIAYLEGDKESYGLD